MTELDANDNQNKRLLSVRLNTALLLV